MTTPGEHRSRVGRSEPHGEPRSAVARIGTCAYVRRRIRRNDTGGTGTEISRVRDRRSICHERATEHRERLPSELCHSGTRDVRVERNRPRAVCSPTASSGAGISRGNRAVVTRQVVDRVLAALRGVPLDLDLVGLSDTETTEYRAVRHRRSFVVVGVGGPEVPGDPARRVRRVARRASVRALFQFDPGFPLCLEWYRHEERPESDECDRPSESQSCRCECHVCLPFVMSHSEVLGGATSWATGVLGHVVGVIRRRHAR